MLSIGPVGNNVAAAIQSIEHENEDAQKQPRLSVAHYDMRFLKPLDEEILQEVAEQFQKIVTVEDGVRIGGLGSAVLEWMSDHGYHPEIVRLGLPDSFVEHGTVEQLQHIVGIDAESIAAAITRKQ